MSDSDYAIARREIAALVRRLWPALDTPGFSLDVNWGARPDAGFLRGTSKILVITIPRDWVATVYDPGIADGAGMVTLRATKFSDPCLHCAEGAWQTTDLDFAELRSHPRVVIREGYLVRYGGALAWAGSDPQQALELLIDRAREDLGLAPERRWGNYR